MNPVEEYIFTVQPFEIDFRGKLTFPLLINKLLNAAGQHADKRGFGIRDINKINRSWVLSRVYLDLTRCPKDRENIKVETWIEGLLRTFTQRNFAIYDETGNALGYARTVWSMIDMETRRPVNLMSFGIDQYIHIKECPVAKGGKIILPDDTSALDTFTIKYSDVDINQHLNSAKYVEHIFDAFSLDEIKQHNTIQRFEIEYVEECRYGEKISIFKKEVQPNDFIIVLKKEDGTITCKSRILFTE